ncbi:MAG: methyltransferase domain-containing protein [Candidatus Paceibacterota bacterium]|jgi:ubiquinone/menaquinone biosynthesis C-methylase UbiE
MEDKRKIRPKLSSAKTSWGKVASWYSGMVEDDSGSYQKDLILPNLLRLMKIQPDENILDLACGQGFFSREFKKGGANVVGADIAPELIKIAKDKSADIKYLVVPADKLSVEDRKFDKATIVLAIQNIENVAGTFSECSRVLKKDGQLFIVMNHPSFRIPKKTSWGWDEKLGIQYRRVDSYLFESQTQIDMHPGEKRREFTITFHRPLQYYVKHLAKAGFAIVGLEEWNSNKVSDSGPRAGAENTARKEIPMFMTIIARKIL